jgi:hypothetical protein
MVKANKIRTARQVSKKLAIPLAPLGLAEEAKTIAAAHSKTRGKDSWIVKYNTDVAIFLGFVWGVGKVLYFYCPDRPWTVWVKIIDTFLPIVALTLAVIYRLYPHINVFFLNKK